MRERRKTNSKRRLMGRIKGRTRKEDRAEIKGFEINWAHIFKRKCTNKDSPLKRCTGLVLKVTQWYRASDVKKGIMIPREEGAMDLLRKVL